MNEYKFVVCGRNVALGIFDTQEGAIAALKASTSVKEEYGDEIYREYSSPVHGQFTICAVRPNGDRLF